ncbi:MAG: hypothetical protein ACLR2E_09070 [Lachnospiraceae bacterium]
MGSQTQESTQEQAKAVESANTFRTNRQATTRFLANSQYFTIAIYVIAVVAIAAVIFKAIISLDQTITWIKNVLNVLMPFIIGFLIAFILNPAVKMFCRLLQKHTKIKKKASSRALPLQSPISFTGSGTGFRFRRGSADRKQFNRPHQLRSHGHSAVRVGI